MKQTAVEWLEKICNDRGYHLMSEYFEQAKEIEKQQIIDARVTAPLINTLFENDYVTEAEQYYNETFKKK